MTAAETRLSFAPKFKPLFQPKRYKTFHGGRGGAKSWAAARALVIMAARNVEEHFMNELIQAASKANLI